VRASVIASLGQDGAGGFSASKFLSQMHDIPPETRDLIFGKANTAAMSDLETIVKNIGQVNKRTHNWGALAVEMTLSGALGFSHSGVGGASTGLLATAGANTAVAHLLARPDTLKWLARLAAASQKGSDALAP